MAVNKLPEFAKNGQKNTDGLTLEDGFPVNLKPARQWFNYLFNELALSINQIIDEKLNKTGGEVTGELSVNKTLTLGLRNGEKFKPVTRILIVPPTHTGLWNQTINDDETFSYYQICYNSFTTFQIDNLGNATVTKLNANEVTASLNGNASTASRLQTSRKINNIDFDGSKDITIKDDTKEPILGFSPVRQGTGEGQKSNPVHIGWSGESLFLQVDNVNFSSAWPISVSGSASTASRLQVARNIALSGAVSGNANFDGSGNVSIPTNLQIGIGINQYYQDVTASRISGVVYTNNTGNTIFLIITASGSNNTALTHQVSGVQFINTNESLSRTISYAVPDGASYMVTAATIYKWSELRR